LKEIHVGCIGFMAKKPDRVVAVLVRKELVDLFTTYALDGAEGAREAPGGSAQAGAERAQPVVGTGPHGLPGAQERGKTRRKLDLELFYEVMP